MKKSLIALAVLAASGAAMAQSTVTVYGIADVWVGSEKTGDVRDSKVGSGGVSGSRWGIKGTEDLGGGLKANFLLEQGFSIDSGAAGTNDSQPGVAQAFSRQSYVGLSGGFGEVKLGKVWTAYDDVQGSSDAVFDSALSPMNKVFISTSNYNSNPANTIYYATPSFGGFAGAVSYSLGENKGTPAGTDATSITAFNVTYGAGPLALQLGYQVEDGKTANDQKFTRLGGTYDLGVAKLYANYGKVSNVGNAVDRDASEYQIGADFPVSSALTLSASYAKSDDSNPAGVYEATRKGYGVGAAYSLSKRTTVYGGYESDKKTNQSAADTKHSLFAVGLKHTF
ncbi:porin [Rhodoferax sp. U11-2br]|uniref:porin n=1 Tax=Rhodoferax sp. U11-2br TaxID=2838878 RepID=UPI001BEB28CB|nr:porin [Rhodoferax sp. U11-2br]MBT3066522.1 porin [Rhodoferax sp. U11-2br]